MSRTEWPALASSKVAAVAPAEASAYDDHVMLCAFHAGDPYSAGVA